MTSGFIVFGLESRADLKISRCRHAMRPMIKTIAITITLLDQFTKWLVCRNFGATDFVTVIPGFFSLRRVLNFGAAWGMLSGQRILLVAVSVAMLVLLWCNRHELRETGPSCRVGIGLLTGGIIGNLIDRVKLGYVVDFLDFHMMDIYVFPTFNVADSAIFLGIVLYFLHAFLSKKRSGNPC